MGYCPLDTCEEDVRLLQSRMCSAVNDFVANALQTGKLRAGSTEALSLDMTTRIFRLEMAVATPENEDFVATMRHTQEKMFRKQLLRQRVELQNCQAQLKEARGMATRSQQDFENMRMQQERKAIIYQREVSRIQKNATQDSRQLVTIHSTERAKAEARALELAQVADKAAKELADAEDLVRTCRAAEAAAKQEYVEV